MPWRWPRAGAVARQQQHDDERESKLDGLVMQIDRHAWLDAHVRAHAVLRSWTWRTSA